MDLFHKSITIHTSYIPMATDYTFTIRKKQLHVCQLITEYWNNCTGILAASKSTIMSYI